MARCEEASNAGLVQPMDYSIIDKSRSLPNLVKRDYIGVYTFGYGMIYQKKKFATNSPKNWVDFWDTKNFPGRRAMNGDGTYVLEEALMADGVPMNDVYKVLKAPEGSIVRSRNLGRLSPTFLLGGNYPRRPPN